MNHEIFVNPRRELDRNLLRYKTIKNCNRKRSEIAVAGRYPEIKRFLEKRYVYKPTYVKILPCLPSIFHFVNVIIFIATNIIFFTTILVSLYDFKYSWY